MKQAILLLLFIFTITHSLSCPAWSCKDDVSQQKNTQDDYHCTEFESGNKVSLYKQNDACKISNTNCFLVETLEFINEESTGTLSGSSSYCYSGLEDDEDFWFLSSESIYISFYKKNCQSYNEDVAMCELFEEEDRDYTEDEYGDEGYNDYEEEVGYSGWEKCTSSSECLQFDECLCIPSDGTFGRCGTSWVDNYLIDLAVVQAACNSKDQETYCILNEFYDSTSATLITSILEKDLDCLSDQTWDTQYYSTFDLEKAMNAYKNARCEDCFSSLLALVSVVMLALL